MSNTAAAIAPPPRPAESHWLLATGTLVTMTLYRQLRSRKTLSLAALLALPAVVAIAARYAERLGGGGAPARPEVAERALVFWMIPQALLPLAALLYASGIVQDEVEEQTLTYLLVRPIPRPVIYYGKLAATVAGAAALAAACVVVTYLALYAGQSWFDQTKTVKICVLFGLAQVAYAPLFAFVSLVLRRSIVIGVIYIALFEGLFANVDFVVRKITVLYYLRVLALRMGVKEVSWRIDLTKAPANWVCVAAVVGVGLLFTLIGGLLFASREWSVKTPESV